MAVFALQQIELGIDPGEALPDLGGVQLMGAQGDVHLPPGQQMPCLHVVLLRVGGPVHVHVDHVGRRVHKLGAGGKGVEAGGAVLLEEGG